MYRFDPSKTVFAGVSTAQLQANLAAAQQAYTDLLTGNKPVSLSYTQGDGAKTATYKPTNVADLTALIQLLQACLGINVRPRRAIGFRYR
jgi:hypothetical protein